MDNSIIKERSQIDIADTWALEDLYTSDETWEQDLNQLEEDKKKLEAYSGKLNDAKQLLSYLQLTEKTQVCVSMLANYCMRKSDEDTSNSKYQAMSGKFMSVAVALEAATSFETPEIMEISDELMDVFYVQCPELERYRRYLTELRRRKAHVLSPVEEKLLAAAGEMAQAPDNVYGMFCDADLTFADAVDSEGKKHPINLGTFVACQESDDRVLRESAYNSLYSGFGAFKNTAAGLLDAQNKQLKFFAEARKYSSAFEASLDSNNVPTDVYLNLIATIRKHLNTMHKYVGLRKRLLGVDELHFYDVYASLVSNVDKKYSYEEAVEIVCEAVAPMGEEYVKVLREAFANRWVDVYQNKGKRSGAYAAGTPVHPYVLMNYNGTLDSLFTLAHEMGHAMHSYLSTLHQPPLDSSYVIFVAEVASTVNEALLMEYMLGRTTDKKERAVLINHFLEQFKGTIFRQTMFAEFELEIGKAVSEGKTLTADYLSTLYKKLNEDYFGPEMIVDDHIAVEWARIPHFYYNYYVFQYATGYSAAIALSRRILDEGSEAVKDYLGFLSGGCSKSPIELLKSAGVDMTEPAPVEKAMALFASLIEDMEQLLKEET